MNNICNDVLRFKDILIKHKAFAKAIDLVDYLHESNLNGKRLLMITGESGVGKTTVFTSVSKNVKRYSKTVPLPASVVHLTDYFLEEMDLWIHDHASIADKMKLFIIGLNEQGVRLIVLDESQHFAKYAKYESVFKYTDWFNQILAETNVCFVLIGLNSSLDVFRKFKDSMCVYDFAPLKYETQEDVAEFQELLCELESQLPLNKPSNLSIFSSEIFTVSQGKMDLITSLVIDAALIAKSTGNAYITSTHLFYSQTNNSLFRHINNPFRILT
ncbi:AAA family ATPase [Peribacillus butanolivorans]|uniref:AAA family ATPase n=1 Tax=Peribacillus butanolivorans TaxID=421767 RepID=UPI0036C810A9